MPCPSRDRIPALLLVVAGLAILVLAGAQMYDLSRERYTYDVSSFDDAYEGFYEYESLSDGGRRVVDSALNASTDEPRVSLADAPEFSSDGGFYYLQYRDEYYCLTVDEGPARGTARVSIERHCSRIDVAGPVVHDASNLSAQGREVFLRALNASDGEFTRYGDTPPDFEGGSDAPELNRGIYFVEYDGDYYRLSVSGRGGFGVGIAMYFFLLVGLTGLCVTVVGAESFYNRRTTLPTVLLAGLGALVALFATGNADLLPVWTPLLFGPSLPLFLVLVVGVLVWFVRSIR